MSGVSPTEIVDASTVPALEIRRLRFSYTAKCDADEAPVVLVPELRLAAGEQMLLTGGSGSGKSTLLHLVAGLLDPDGGSVRIAGIDMHAQRGPARDRLRGRRIGMIFQTFHLLPGFSAIENVMLALLFGQTPPAEHRRRALSLLEELGIEDPTRSVEQLSVGQQQRVAVARAVACSPALVLADEPTASLDPATAATAMDLIQRTCERTGAALLCTSHDPAMAERFSRRTSMTELRHGMSEPRTGAAASVAAKSGADA